MVDSVQVPAEALTEAREGRVYDRLGARVWVAGAIIVLVGLVTTYLILQDFSSKSYIYLAFYSIPANTGISVFPHEPVLIYFGQFASLWLAALAATVGTIAAGYLDHAVFVPVLNHKTLVAYKARALYRRAIDYFLRFPFATLIVAGFMPIPFFPFKFLSFSIHYPLRKYLAALVIARYPRYFLLALLGRAVHISNWILYGAFLVVINLYLVKAVPAVLGRMRERKARRAADALETA